MREHVQGVYSHGSWVGSPMNDPHPESAQATMRALVDAYAATTPGTAEREAAWEEVCEFWGRSVVSFVFDEFAAGRLQRGPLFGIYPPPPANRVDN